MAKQKPRQVYQCPICDKILNYSYEEAQQHVDIPIDTSLPIGLVLKEGDSYCGRTATPYVIITSNNKSIWWDHGIKQNCYDGTKTDRGSWETSRSIKKSLLEGSYRILTEDEFKVFRFRSQDWSDCEKRVNRLVRTTPKLNKILNLKK